jgi:hypothetical protein
VCIDSLTLAVLAHRIVSTPFREVQQVARELQAEERPRITEKQPFDMPQK